MILGHAVAQLVGPLCYKLDVAGSIRESFVLFNLPKGVPEISLEGKARPARKSDNLAANCEQII
jgi:hypothetical protein